MDYNSDLVQGYEAGLLDLSMFMHHWTIHTYMWRKQTIAEIPEYR